MAEIRKMKSTRRMVEHYFFMVSLANAVRGARFSRKWTQAAALLERGDARLRRGERNVRTVAVIGSRWMFDKARRCTKGDIYNKLTSRGNVPVLRRSIENMRINAIAR
jgi:hypothetical protein